VSPLFSFILFFALTSFAITQSARAEREVSHKEATAAVRLTPFPFRAVAGLRLEKSTRTRLRATPVEVQEFTESEWPVRRATLARPAPRPPVLTLEQAYDLTLSSDQAIRSAMVELRNARLEPWSALTRMGPQITGNLSYEAIREQRTNNPGPTTAPLTATADTAPAAPANPFAGAGASVGTMPTGAAPTAPVPQPSDPALGTAGTATPDFGGTHNHTRRAGIFFQLPLLDLTVFPAWRFGRLSAASAELRRQYIVRETLFGVARAYYAVLRARAIVDVNRETVALARDQAVVAESRFSLGDVARSDVLQAESVVQAARRTLIESEGLLELNRNNLTNILNLHWDTPFTVAEPADAPALREDYGFILMNAFQKREDFRASSNGIDQSVERRKEVAASYAPRVVAQAQHDWTDVTTNTSNLEAQRIWTAVVAVQVPFFTGGQREVDLRRASHNIDQAHIDHEKLTKSIQAEVRQAWIDVRTLRGSIAALEAEVQAVEGAYRDLSSNYEVGKATSLDVAAGLRDRNNARATLAGSRYDYQVALRNLERAEASFQTGRVRASRVK
jgi:outer membrane protein TolC